MYHIRSCGGSAVTVEFENRVAPEVNGCVMALARKITQKKISGITEVIPAFRALTVIFDPCRISEEKVRRTVNRLAKDLSVSSESGRVFHIPVCYSRNFGCDLADVAAIHGISVSEVIDRHSSRDYLIYMLGFLPGFPYLGGLDEALATPRLESPRTVVPAGAVGIGGEQTGVYPVESPGGWRIIGRTPLKLFDPGRADPILYRAGDYIRFIPIDEEKYAQIERAVADGTYKYTIDNVRTNAGGDA